MKKEKAIFLIIVLILVISLVVSLAFNSYLYNQNLDKQVNLASSLQRENIQDLIGFTDLKVGYNDKIETEVFSVKNESISWMTCRDELMKRGLSIKLAYPGINNIPNSFCSIQWARVEEKDFSCTCFYVVKD